MEYQRPLTEPTRPAGDLRGAFQATLVDLGVSSPCGQIQAGRTYVSGEIEKIVNGALSISPNVREDFNSLPRRNLRWSSTQLMRSV
jgi:hypothetical protein